MKFGEKLKEQREKHDLTQSETAARIGISLRTMRNYETCSSYPQDRSIYYKFADLFKVDVNYFLTEDEEFLTEAAKIYGKRGQDQARVILEQSAALFAGGELSESDQIAFLHEMQGLFLESKKIARDRYTPKKHKAKNN